MTVGFDIHDFYARIRVAMHDYARFGRFDRIADIALARAGGVGDTWGNVAKVTDIEVLDVEVEDDIVAQITYVIRIHAENEGSGRECDTAVTITATPQSPYDTVEAYSRVESGDRPERVLALDVDGNATGMALDRLVNEMVPVVEFLLGGKND